MANRSWMASTMFASKCKVSPLYFHEGRTVVDGYFASLMECEVVVKKISIYKAPLGIDLRQASAQGAGSSRSKIHHHFLIVEVSQVQHPTGGVLQGFSIRAEKFGEDPQNPEGSAGINVNPVPLIVEGSAAEAHYGLAFNKRIQLKKLIEILTAHPPDYDFLCDNCWKYADATFKALKDTLQATTGSNEVQQQGRSQIRVHEETMPLLVMPIDMLAILGASAVLTGCMYRGLKWWTSRQDGEEEEEENKVPAKARS